eukprot:1549001-Amphidinium_carterae.1
MSSANLSHLDYSPNKTEQVPQNLASELDQHFDQLIQGSFKLHPSMHTLNRVSDCKFSLSSTWITISGVAAIAPPEFRHLVRQLLIEFGKHVE